MLWRLIAGPITTILEFCNDRATRPRRIGRPSVLELEMTLDEVMDPETVVTRSEALHECRRHGIDPDEMLAELGDSAQYASVEVMRWLGY